MKAFISFLLPLAVIALFAATLLFIVRIFVALFSPKVSQRMRKHPVIHIVWGCFSAVGGLVCLWVLNPNIWPPVWIERRSQRQEVLERIQSAGGWAALKRDCDTLAAAFQDDPYGFRWLRGSTNSLPATISALKPKEVEFYSRRVLQEFGNEGHKWFGTNVVVRISIFGGHATIGCGQTLARFRCAMRNRSDAI